MKHFVSELMEKMNFPLESKNFLLDLLCTVNNNCQKEFEGIIKYTYETIHVMDYAKAEKELTAISEKIGIHKYSMILLYFLACSSILKERYNKAGIDEKIFWNTVYDLKYKLIECQNVYGIHGTFVGDWFPGFFNMTRFGLGNFQYDDTVFMREDTIINGKVIKKGDPILGLHIPSSGPLTKEAREDSYRKAYNFFGHKFDEEIVIQCNSWLLFPDNRKFFPKHSNILDFMDDFNIIDFNTEDHFSNAWRIFGKHHQKPINELPLDTSLQRSFVEWIKAGNKTGTGYGIKFYKP